MTETTATDAEKAMAYLVLDGVLDGKYWPIKTIEWCRRLVKSETRTGAQLVADAIAAAEAE